MYPSVRKKLVCSGVWGEVQRPKTERVSGEL